MSRRFRAPRRFVVPCVIEVEHSEASLHAHVHLDGVELGPGDRVKVHGAPVQVRFGDKVTLRREASVERAGWLRRCAVEALERLRLFELYEVSFTSGRRL